MTFDRKPSAVGQLHWSQHSWQSASMPMLASSIQLLGYSLV